MAETINKTQVASGATAKTVPAASIPATRKAPGLHPARPTRGLQFSSMVQRRMRPARAQFRRAKLALESRNGKRTIWRDGLSQSAVLCLLHQFCEGLSRLHPNAGEN